MTARILLRVVVVASGISVFTAAQDAPPVFRSSIDSVLVDVSVRERGRPVTNLDAREFEVRDNGMPQAIVDISREQLPIDVTFVVDLSGSVNGPLLDALNRALPSVEHQLGPDDRASLITFNQRIHEVSALQTTRWRDVRLDRPVGQTSLLDALTIALIAPPEPGRRRMVMAFTDGLDTTSFVEGESVIDVARRAESAIFTVALASGTTRAPQRAAHERLFQTLADMTGGALAVLQQDQDLGGSFARAFEDFRTSYVLRYTYAGPVRPGWHTLAVHVTRRGNYDIRARQGYFAGD